MKKLALHWQILIGMAAGVLFGLLAAKPLGAKAVRVAGALIAAGGVYFLAA